MPLVIAGSQHCPPTTSAWSIDQGDCPDAHITTWHQKMSGKKFQFQESKLSVRLCQVAHNRTTLLCAWLNRWGPTYFLRLSATLLRSSWPVAYFQSIRAPSCSEKWSVYLRSMAGFQPEGTCKSHSNKPSRYYTYETRVGEVVHGTFKYDDN